MAKILVIDDNETLLEVISNSLKRTGHQSITTKHTYNIEKILNQSKFDLVVTDIIMPDKEGIEIIMYLRKNYPEIKIIAISGKKISDNLDLLDIAKNIGADATLLKPFLTEDLVALIDSILGQNI